MQRVFVLLFILILPCLIFSEVQDGFSSRSDLREFRASPDLAFIGDTTYHPALESIRYAFYPPRKSEALYIRPSRDSVTELRLVFAGSTEERYLRIPASGEGNLIKIPLDAFPELSTLDLSLDAGFYFTPPSDALSGIIHPDRPEELVLAFPVSDPSGMKPSSSGESGSVDSESPESELPESESKEESAETMTFNDSGEDLVLTLMNPEPIHIGSDTEYDAVLRPHNKARTFQFPLASGEVWTISPLTALESFSFHRENRPEFPLPLNREGMQILNADPASWRNRDFEVYRWSSLPEVLIFDCRNYEIQNRFFRRLAFFVEKKGYRGQILGNEALKGKHGWNANDYRASDLASFFNKAGELETELYDEEILLRDILVREGILVEDGNRLKEGVGAVNSMALESGPFLRYRFFTHEASHGIYFTQKEYRDFVKGFWEALEEEDRELWRLYLSWNAYDPEDEDLMMNEFQAYFTQQPVSEAADYLMPRMAYSGRTSFPLRTLFEKKKEELPGMFLRWAEGIEAFQKEHWGLEAGNFSPLQAEWPRKNE